ncbi:ribonuclease [Skermanella stibiiresistens SB22]|uniref:Ribonuclease VapC n=1 Tax=Skermanella stibiiresistens SB22 TaxID=1385369 RepID=W9H0B6_9PROT|nr:type II toxin-antitoxin system VapC family toxin [Skermanella stibiiresistens]EWY39524.1 ribonuclease [Skermanella stibiiresistens SB22]
MVIDTSAVIAILLKEPEAALLADTIAGGSPRLMSAASLLEASMVIETRKGEAGGRELDLFIYRAGIEIVPVDQEQAEMARAAWRRYGKGRHPAGLNYGDCFSYALAKVRGASLVFKGDDFSRTDLCSSIN